MREEGARAAAAALAPRVPKLVIDVPADVRVDGLSVTRDGIAVGAPQWGTAVPLDAGEHTVEASAPGHETWRTVVVVPESGAAPTTIVPKLVKAPQREEVLPPERKPAPQTAPPFELGTQRIVALGAGGVGVVGLAIGTIFGVKAMSNKSDAQQSCDGAACRTDEGVAAGNAAHSAGNVATVGMIVAAAGLAGGLVLWFTAPSEKPAAEVSVGLGRVEVRGVW
jgi:hypothetical protein